MLDLGQFDLGQSWFFRLGPMVDSGQFDLGQLAQIVDFRVLCCGVLCFGVLWFWFGFVLVLLWFRGVVVLCVVWCCGVVVLWCCVVWGVCSRFSWVRPRFGCSPGPLLPSSRTAQNFALCSLSRHNFLSSLSWGSSRGILVVF